MKFHQVNIGEQFVFQGETFTKASPVLACNNISGEQRFMRRADGVQSCNDVIAKKAIPKAGASVQIDQVLLLVDEYVDEVVSAIKTNVDGLSREQHKTIGKLMKRQRGALHKSLDRYKE